MEYTVDPSFEISPTSGLVIPILDITYCLSSEPVDFVITDTSGPGADLTSYVDLTDEEIDIPSCTLVALASYDFELRIYYTNFAHSG
mmetsp:Transcript_28603/g.25568  ORF Transcript_28603/g.25568 Transcript_28603/m.25568 type:complete len:87 (-) Transcript_28603:4190-4450(-)